MTAPEATDDRTGPVSGQQIRHGPGVTATRAFPTENYPAHLDPFVLFERFYIDPERGFPMHRHEGFEIVTYMLDGGMDHADSLGVEHTAYEDEAMRITAGGGIEHSEFPADGAACSGLQLWVTLPREKKDVDADYADATADDLPTAELDGATVTTVVGDGSPLELYTATEYLDVRVTDAWTWPVDDEWAGFLYGIDGAGTVDGDPFGDGDVLHVTDGREIGVRGDESLRVVAVAGQPHEEPIQQRGPIVR